MKSINTYFNGDRFRSRLEARWALFLTEMGWVYDYEPEGFVLDNGTCYLPDFYISDLDTWIEVKPDLPTDEEIEKLRLLSAGFPNSFVMLANGLPANRAYRCWHNGQEVSQMVYDYPLVEDLIRKFGLTVSQNSGRH